MNVIIPYRTEHPSLCSYRLRRHATALQSPYMVQPSIKFSTSSSVANQILCSMYDFFLIRFDFKCLGPDKLVDNKVVTMLCRILNGKDKENKKHFLSLHFAVRYVVRIIDWEKLLTQLIMSPKKEVRENVYRSMDQ
ncbi:hypothetical protein AAG906_007381 [Vitis piasezkii]